MVKVITIDTALKLKELEQIIEYQRGKNPTRFHDKLRKYQEILKTANIREEDFSYDLTYQRVY